ncbi:hypothetical protein [Piscinibacter sp.]|uniref:hypothetical protein n=1 Tax=Piscinibacter sp. TaxID=1903157 RepID=UPI00355A8CA0
MKRFRLLLLASVMALVADMSLAQGGPGMGMGAGPAASAPGMGMGPGMRSGRGPAARSGADFTPGWSLMTPAERSEHQQRMRSMTSYDECKSYMEQHREQMAARATEKGGAPLRQPRRDACAGLKP